jgi:SAM-dependent methyltransferase
MLQQTTKIRYNHCPCCKSSDFRFWWNNKVPKPINDWKEFFFGGRRFIKEIISCRSCGYSFINSLCENSENWYSKQDTEVYRSMETFRKDYFEHVKKDFQKRFSKTFPTDAAALDLACGDGLWLQLWYSQMKLFGTELSGQFKKILAQKDITVLKEEELRNREFDIISMFDFLEHIESPDVFLADKWNLVKPGGCLIIGVPDMGKIAAKIFGSRYYLVCPMHYSYFNSFSLNKLLNNTCTDAKITIYPSPPLSTDLNGMIKWLGFKPVPKSLNMRLHLKYSPSLIAVATKQKVSL